MEQVEKAIHNLPKFIKNEVKNGVALAIQNLQEININNKAAESEENDTNQVNESMSAEPMNEAKASDTVDVQ